MKASTISTIKHTTIVTLAMFIIGCGTDDSGSESQKDSNRSEEKSDSKGKELSEEEAQKESGNSSGSILDGKYYLSSGTFEGSDSAGNKIDRQTLQIAGDYYWTTKHQGNDQYEVTATGTAKLSSDNNVLAELNCVGSQDVYSFDVISSGTLRNFAQLEAGCPQAAQLNSSQQMSIRSLNDNSFQYTVVTQSEGTRIVETYVFRK